MNTLYHNLLISKNKSSQVVNLDAFFFYLYENGVLSDAGIILNFSVLVSLCIITEWWT